VRPTLRVPIGFGESFSGQVVATGKPLAVPDTRDDPRLRYAQHAGQYGLLSYLGLPVKVGDRVIGVLVFNADAPRVYAEDEIAFLSSFADQAAIAIENARLHEGAVQRARRLEILNHVTRMLTTGLDPGAVFKGILAAVQALLPGAAARLWEWPKGSDELHLVASIGLRDPEGGVKLRMRPGEGLLGLAASTRQPVISPDVTKDPRFINKAWAAAEGLVSSVTLPLVHGETVHGVLAISTRTPHQFSEEEVNLLSSFAAQAAIAIENARLHEAVRRHAEELESKVRERTAELEEALRVKVEFLGKMSHELRTPLNFVVGFSELLQQGIGGPLTPKQATYVDRVLTGGKRLLSLVNDVLDIAQVDAGKSRLRLEPVILGPLIQEVLGLVQVQATQKRLKVTTALDPWLPFIVADRFKLGQILHNLVDNAVKFTPDGGSITIRTYQEAEGRKQKAESRRQKAEGSGQTSGELPPLPTAECPLPTAECRVPPGWPSVVIEVEDTGIGIQPENLGTVFEAFYQVDGSETRAYGGAGLGLPLVKKLVEMHGGRVWAESPGPGQGTRVVVRLPRLEVPPPKRILAVEDERTVLDALGAALTGAGYAVERVETGTQALAALVERPPDLLVLDIGLPDMDGWEILRRLREDDRSRVIPVLVLTGLEHVHANQALALGADEFLAKPISARVLVETVSRLLTQPATVRAVVEDEPGFHTAD